MLTISKFLALFASLNKWQSNDFRSWIFEAGMNYGDQEFWWPSQRQKRPASHEGIDFFCYEDAHGGKRFLDQAKVPCPSDGQVVAVCKDFLGETVFVATADQTDPIDLFVFAHLVPRIELGQAVRGADAVGVIAPGSDKVPGHLHVSALQGDWHDLPRDLSWPALNAQKKLQFVYPFLQ
ncbi:MAG: hypothetical protein ABFS09_02165 [Thermodesulfobacteriota bacterium]